MTDSEHLILLVLGPIGSLVLAGLVCFHRNRVYAAWTKIASILALIAGAGWGALGFVLMYWRSYHFTRATFYALLGLKGLLGGIAIGFILSILMARPYRKIGRNPTHENQA